MPATEPIQRPPHAIRTQNLAIKIADLIYAERAQSPELTPVDATNALMDVLVGLAAENRNTEIPPRQLAVSLGSAVMNHYLKAHAFVTKIEASTQPGG